MISNKILIVNLLLIWLIVLFGTTYPSLSVASGLSVEVLGVRSNKGFVHFGLYKDPATFPSKDGRSDGVKKVIFGNRSFFVFKGLNPGHYALAVFHDENANGEFDQNFIGFPLEDFGFSNDAGAFLGPPDFFDAAVFLPPEGLKTTIRLD